MNQDLDPFVEFLTPQEKTLYRKTFWHSIITYSAFPASIAVTIWLVTHYAVFGALIGLTSMGLTILCALSSIRGKDRLENSLIYQAHKRFTDNLFLQHWLTPATTTPQLGVKAKYWDENNQPVYAVASVLPGGIIEVARYSAATA